MINPQRYETKANLPVYSADSIVLHPVEKKYQERHDTGHKDQCRYNGQNLRVRSSSRRRTASPILSS